MNYGDKHWFIYVLRDPNTLEVRYVGVAHRPDKRFVGHVRGALKCKLTKKDRWIRGLLLRDECPLVDIVDDGYGEAWSQYEKEWISYHRYIGHRLTNATDGGEGAVPDAETRAKIGMSSRGRRWNTEARVRFGNARRGQKRSLETRRKIGLKHRGKVMSPEARKKISVARTGKRHSAEVVTAVAAKNHGKRRSQETKDKISAKRLGWNPSQETRLKMSASARKRSVRGPRSEITKLKISTTQIAQNLLLSGIDIASLI